MGFSNHPLNVSNHVPLNVSLNVGTSKVATQSVPPARIHSERAVSMGAILDLTKDVNVCISRYRYVNYHLDDIDDLDKEVQSVCGSVHAQYALNCIPSHSSLDARKGPAGSSVVSSCSSSAKCVNPSWSE